MIVLKSLCSAPDRPQRAVWLPEFVPEAGRFNIPDLFEHVIKCWGTLEQRIKLLQSDLSIRTSVANGELSIEQLCE